MMSDRTEATHACPLSDGRRWEILQLTYGRARIVLTDGFGVYDNY